MFDQYKKLIWNKLLSALTGSINTLTGMWAELRIDYGILGLAAFVAVLLKLLLFYSLIGVTSNFFFVWAITAGLTYLLFASFRNKWIPASIYMMLSILMLCDVTYSSFFNRYLSVNMLGAAGFLGDIIESIKEVLKPWFFLTLADAALIFAALAKGTRHFEDSINYPCDNRKRLFIKWATRHKRPITALLIICLLVFNFSGSFLITSLSNQEIYSYHIKDIVNKVTGNGVNVAGSEFMAAVTDSYEMEKDGPLFGVGKGRNLIVIQMESLQNLVVNKVYNGQEITPNLNQLIKGDSVYFDHYYQQVGSGNTSDAEFATNNSVYGSIASYTYKLYEDNYFRGLPKLLKEQGYSTVVYHAHEDRHFWNREGAYKSLGFDTYRGGIGGMDKGQYEMTEWMGWGLTDTEFYKQTMPYLTEMQQPFYSFIISLSNHHPYLMLDKYQFIDLLPEDKDTIFGNYLNSAAYTDYAIGQLIQQLKDEGLYENSVIALYGDHMGLAKTDDEINESVLRFLGKEYDFDTMMNIPFIVHIPKPDRDVNQTISISGGQLDFLPTIAYLMGFDKLDTVYLGHNLLTVDSGFVAEQTYMTKGSFFQDDIAYEMSRDGVFENGRAWNTKTGKTVPIKDCYDGYMKSMGIINTSEYILKNDVLRKIYEGNQDIVSAFSNTATAVVGYPKIIAAAGAPDIDLIGTNSLEALNASYDAGYRNIGINVCWTEDKEAVLLSSWQDLGKNFDTNQNQEITLDEFRSLEMKNGLTSMDFLDLIAWVKERPDVKVYVQAERSEDYFMKCMESYAGSIMDQFVAMVPGMVEYSGLYPSVLNIDIGEYSVEQLLEFIELNNVAAVAMSKEGADGKYKEILDAECISYVIDDETGLLTKRN